MKELSPDEIVRVDALCLGPAHGQVHAHYNPGRMLRFLKRWPKKPLLNEKERELIGSLYR